MNNHAYNTDQGIKDYLKFLQEVKYVYLHKPITLTISSKINF
jgi:hypothetical protein